jgi:hypothetical protein
VLRRALLDAAETPSDPAFREAVRVHVEFGSKVATQTLTPTLTTSCTRCARSPAERGRATAATDARCSDGQRRRARDLHHTFRCEPSNQAEVVGGHHRHRRSGRREVPGLHLGDRPPQHGRHARLQRPPVGSPTSTSRRCRAHPSSRLSPAASRVDRARATPVRGRPPRSCICGKQQWRRRYRLHAER